MAGRILRTITQCRRMVTFIGCGAVTVMCGGNGGTTTNRRGQAILVLVGNNEQPTQDAIEGVRWAIAHIQEKHPGAKKVLGHRDSFEASTACLGTSSTAWCVRACSTGRRRVAALCPWPGWWRI